MLQVPSRSRLLHSPCLVVVGLSVGYEIWFPIGWFARCVISLSKYRLGISSHVVHCGCMWLMGIFTVFKGHWQSPCTALMAGKCLPLGLCKGTMKECTPGYKQVLSKPHKVWQLSSSTVCISHISTEISWFEVHHPSCQNIMHGHWESYVAVKKTWSCLLHLNNVPANVVYLA